MSSDVESVPEDPSARRGAYPWGSARMDELKAWRALPATSGEAQTSPERFHRWAKDQLTQSGYQVEEEPPRASEGPSKKHPDRPRTIEGAVQGERGLRWDRVRGRRSRSIVLSLLIAGFASIALFVIGAYLRNPDLVGFLFVALVLLPTGGVLLPNTRKFLSELAWVTYESPSPGGPVAFQVRTARVASGNFRSRHSRQRMAAGFSEKAAEGAFTEAPGGEPWRQKLADLLSAPPLVS